MNGQFWVGPTPDPDKFRLGPAVASGAEGVLYKAYIDTESGPLQIALKMLHPSHLENLGAWRDRWKLLVEMLAKVQVPGLVAVRGGFVGPLPHLEGQAEKSVTSLYLCMDWVEGIPLDRWARGVNNATPEQLLGALVPVASALDLLHSGVATGGQAVVHRDVKPANILIRPAGDTVLVDVGSMRGLTTETRRSGVVGTPGYIAPEVRRDSAYSPASDRYALGAVAFFLLTGNEPPTEGGIAELRRRLESAPLLAHRSDVVDHVVAMLADDPARRPSKLANWVAQLRRSSLGILPGDLAIPPRAPTRRAVAQPRPASKTSKHHRRRRSLATIVAVFVLSGALLGYLLLRPDGAPPKQASSETDLDPVSETQLIVFEGRAGEDQDSQIYSVRSNGAERRKLTSSGGTEPALSPDGTKVVFVRNDDLFVMNIDGSDERRITQLTSGPSINESPAWSPDGQRIAFAGSDGEGDSRLFVVGSDGSGFAQLSRNNLALKVGDHSPAWSPRGDQIAFLRDEQDDGSGAKAIFTMGVDGTNETRVMNKLPTARPAGLAWSPDGAAIAFTHGFPCAAGPGLWTVTPVGTGLRALDTAFTDEPEACSVGRPIWSANGERMSFHLQFRCAEPNDCSSTAKNGLYSITAAGKGLRPVVLDHQLAAITTQASSPVSPSELTKTTTTLDADEFGPSTLTGLTLRGIQITLNRPLPPGSESLFHRTDVAGVPVLRYVDDEAVEIIMREDKVGVIAIYSTRDYYGIVGFHSGTSSSVVRQHVGGLQEAQFRDTKMLTRSLAGGLAYFLYDYDCDRADVTRLDKIGIFLFVGDNADYLVPRYYGQQCPERD